MIIIKYINVYELYTYACVCVCCIVNRGTQNAYTQYTQFYNEMLLVVSSRMLLLLFSLYLTTYFVFALSNSYHLHCDERRKKMSINQCYFLETYLKRRRKKRFVSFLLLLNNKRKEKNNKNGRKKNKNTVNCNNKCNLIKLYHGKIDGNWINYILLVEKIWIIENF